REVMPIEPAGGCSDRAESTPAEGFSALSESLPAKSADRYALAVLSPLHLRGTVTWLSSSRLTNSANRPKRRSPFFALSLTVVAKGHVLQKSHSALSPL